MGGCNAQAHGRHGQQGEDIADSASLGRKADRQSALLGLVDDHAPKVDMSVDAEKRMLQHLGKADGRVLQQGVASRGHDDAGVGKQGLEGDVSQVLHQGHDRQVAAPVDHALQRICGRQIVHGDADRTMRRVKRFQQLRQAHGRHHQGGGHADLALPGRCFAVEVLQEAAQAAQRLRGLHIKPAACRRELNPPGRSVQQSDQQLLLQPPHSVADRGLRQVQLFGRATEAAELGHHQEGLQVLQADVEPIALDSGRRRVTHGEVGPDMGAGYGPLRPGTSVHSASV